MESPGQSHQKALSEPKQARVAPALPMELALEVEPLKQEQSGGDDSRKNEVPSGLRDEEQASSTDGSAADQGPGPPSTPEQAAVHAAPPTLQKKEREKATPTSNELADAPKPAIPEDVVAPEELPKSREPTDSARVDVPITSEDQEQPRAQQEEEEYREEQKAKDDSRGGPKAGSATEAALVDWQAEPEEKLVANDLDGEQELPAEDGAIRDRQDILAKQIKSEPIITAEDWSDESDVPSVSGDGQEQQAEEEDSMDDFSVSSLEDDSRREHGPELNSAVAGTLQSKRHMEDRPATEEVMRRPATSKDESPGPEEQGQEDQSKGEPAPKEGVPEEEDEKENPMEVLARSLKDAVAAERLTNDAAPEQTPPQGGVTKRRASLLQVMEVIREGGKEVGLALHPLPETFFCPSRRKL